MKIEGPTSASPIANPLPVSWPNRDVADPAGSPQAPSRGDRLSLSPRTPLDADRRLGTVGSGRSGSGESADSSKTEDSPDGTGLTDDEKREVKELRSRDAEVRAHEQAHLAAAGGLAQGGAKFDYETGPDGRRYATGGEVGIAMRTGSTPEETIRNAQRVQAAAMAPGDPSATDQQTAAAAARMAQEARQELSSKSVSGGAGTEDAAVINPTRGSSAGTRAPSRGALAPGGRIASREATIADSHAAPGRE